MDSDRLLSYRFIKTHPIDAARILEKLSVKEISIFLEGAPSSLTMDVIKLFNPPTAVNCLNSMSTKSCAAIVEQLPPEMASVLLRRMEKGRIENVLTFLTNEKAELLRSLLKYPEGTAGALMDPMVFTLPHDITISEALKRIRKNPENVIYYIYVLNRDHHLVGFLNIRQLMLAASNDPISSIMISSENKLSPQMAYRSILANPGWTELHALPVVDEKGVFLGAIGYRTLRFLEMEAEQATQVKIGSDAGTALGELYWIGLSSLLKGPASIVKSK